jgi:hypothetical protein
LSAAAVKIKPNNNVNPEPQNQTMPTRRLSIDTWAVILGLALAGLVRLGLLKHIAW